jgi:hypothetical protein
LMICGFALLLTDENDSDEILTDRRS